MGGKKKKVRRGSGMGSTKCRQCVTRLAVAWQREEKIRQMEGKKKV